MNDTDHFPLHDDNTAIPPIPNVGESGTQVCSTVRLYLAILDDLPPEQVRPLLQHVQTCAACAREQRIIERTTRIFANLPASTPSPHIDQAIMAAVAARAHSQRPLAGVAAQRQSSNGHNAADAARWGHAQNGRVNLKRVSLKWGTLTAVAAAVLLLAFLVSMHVPGASTPQAFTLPANLSWNGYVLYHSQTMIATNGERYTIDTYHDLGSGDIHVETVMPGSLDVVAVGDGHTMLGLDMMHHVAQWGANGWSVDESTFDLARLRSDIAAQRATYLDTDTFHNQAVYRIRFSDGLVLLLNMHYQPVNVLIGAAGPGTGEPIYDKLMLMPSSHVSSSMWNMHVPNGFRMGTLPAKP